MDKIKALQERELSWEPHPQLKDAQVAYLLSHRDEEADLTIMLVSLPRGIQVEKHTHDGSDDIVRVIRGKGKMWIDGVGDVILERGSFVRIPKGVLHQPHSIEEDMVVYDVFYPFLV
jgi:quercetin dioxygenase-like cupin family protein